MMNNTYESPKIELVEIAVDVVTASIGETDPEQGPTGPLEW